MNCQQVKQYVGGKTHTQLTQNVKKETLQAIIEETVKPGTAVNTNEWQGYNDLAKAGFKHRVINQSNNVYVTRNIHTQTIDDF